MWEADSLFVRVPCAGDDALRGAGIEDRTGGKAARVQERHAEGERTRNTHAYAPTFPRPLSFPCAFFWGAESHLKKALVLLKDPRRSFQDPTNPFQRATKEKRNPLDYQR